MASTNKTINLGLNKWVGTDKPKRTDFVADNEILDTVISEHIEDETVHLTAADRELLTSGVATDLFAGNGTEELVLTLPFEPKALIVFKIGCSPVEYETQSGYPIVNFAVAFPTAPSAGISLDRNKAYLSQSQSAPASGSVFYNLNESQGQYGYIAFR